MDLLDFARGPGLAASVLVFVSGVGWRLTSVLRRPRMPDLSPAREGAPAPWQGALRHVMRGLPPRSSFGAGYLFSAFNAYVFHVGLALVFFGYNPHIAFIERHIGLSWPALPDDVMYVIAGLTIASLLVALLLRLSRRVLRLISCAEDWVSWTLTFLPLVTGAAVIALMMRYGLYREPLALHLLAFELLLVWFPFGKLMHAFLFPLSRGATGVRFSHRGVQP